MHRERQDVLSALVGAHAEDFLGACDPATKDFHREAVDALVFARKVLRYLPQVLDELQGLVDRYADSARYTDDPKDAEQMLESEERVNRLIRILCDQPEEG